MRQPPFVNFWPTNPGRGLLAATREGENVGWCGEEESLCEIFR